MKKKKKTKTTTQKTFLDSNFPYKKIQIHTQTFIPFFILLSSICFLQAKKQNKYKKRRNNHFFWIIYNFWRKFLLNVFYWNMLHSLNLINERFMFQTLKRTDFSFPERKKGSSFWLFRRSFVLLLLFILKHDDYIKRGYAIKWHTSLCCLSFYFM